MIRPRFCYPMLPYAPCKSRRLFPRLVNFHSVQCEPLFEDQASCAKAVRPGPNRFGNYVLGK